MREIRELPNNRLTSNNYSINNNSLDPALAHLNCLIEAFHSLLAPPKPSMTTKAKKFAKKHMSCFFKASNTETASLLSSDIENNSNIQKNYNTLTHENSSVTFTLYSLSLLFLFVLLRLAFYGISFASGGLYYGGGQGGGAEAWRQNEGYEISQFHEKLELSTLFTWMFWIFAAQLLPWGGVITNGLANTQVNIELKSTIERLNNTTAAEEFLTGQVSKKPWYMGLLIGLGALIPNTTLSYKHLSSPHARIMTIISAIFSFPTAVFGAQTLQRKIAPQFFAEKIDDSRKQEERVIKSIDKIKQKINERIYYFTLHATQEAAEGRTELLNTFINMLKDVQSSQNDINAHNKLREFYNFVLYHNIHDLKDKKQKSCPKQAVQGTLQGLAWVAGITTQLSYIMTGAFAGYDLVHGKIEDYPVLEEILEYSLAAMAGGLTAFSAGGFGVYGMIGSCKWIRGENEEQKVLKQISPKLFIGLAALMVMACLFSGGSGFLAGYTAFERLLLARGDKESKELAKIIPKITEVLGYGGAFFANLPYCTEWASWLLTKCYLQFGNENNQHILQMIKGAQDLMRLNTNTKAMHIHTLVQENIFGYPEQLKQLGLLPAEVDKLFDSQNNNPSNTLPMLN